MWRTSMFLMRSSRFISASGIGVLTKDCAAEWALGLPSARRKSQRPFRSGKCTQLYRSGEAPDSVYDSDFVDARKDSPKIGILVERFKRCLQQPATVAAELPRPPALMGWLTRRSTADDSRDQLGSHGVAMRGIDRTSG